MFRSAQHDNYGFYRIVTQPLTGEDRGEGDGLSPLILTFSRKGEKERSRSRAAVKTMGLCDSAYCFSDLSN